MKTTSHYFFSITIAILFQSTTGFSQCNADFVVLNDSTCNQNISFTAIVGTNSSSAIYEWDFDDNGGVDAIGISVSNDFQAYGTGVSVFPVTLTVSIPNTTCTESYTASVTILEAPDPSFDLGNTQHCDPGSPIIATITNTSTTQSVNDEYHIDWGMGPIEIITNFTTQMFTYPPGTEGNQNITVTAYDFENPNGCTSSTATNSFYIGLAPAIGISIGQLPSAACGPFDVTVNLENWDSNSIGTLYEIYFSDGNGIDPDETFLHPPPEFIVHTFNTSSCGIDNCTNIPDVHDVCIVASNPCTPGVFASVSLLAINTAPDAMIEIYPPAHYCPGEEFEFCDDSDNTGFFDVNTFGCTSDETFYNWSISPSSFTITDGELDEECISVTFGESVPYTITLETGNPCGSDITTQIVHIDTLPLASFIPEDFGNSDCVPYTVAFQNTSTHYDSTLWDITPGGWEFSDTISDLKNDSIEVIFNTPGIYYITLNAISHCDTSIVVDSIIVGGTPIIEIDSIEDACLELEAEVIINVEDNFSAMLNCFIDAPGGIPSTLNSCDSSTIFYECSDTSYQIIATAENLCGAAMDTVDFMVFCPSIVETDPDTALCVDDPCVTFSAFPMNGGTWSGDVSSNGTFCPSLADTFYGYYSVGLGVCLTTDTITIVVNELPVIDMPSDITVCVDAIPFPLIIINYPNECNWTGTIDTCGLFDPAVAGPGDHLLTFCYQDPLTKCTGCGEMTVTVVASPIPDLPDAKSFCATNSDVDLNDCLETPPPPNVTGVWSSANCVIDPNTGIINSGSISDTCEIIYIQITTEGGCVASDTMTLFFLPAEDAVAWPDTTICLEEDNLTVFGTPPLGDWYSVSGLGNPIATSTGVITIIDPGIFVYEYVAFEGESCETRDSLTVEVVDYSNPDIGNDLHYCEGYINIPLPDPAPDLGIWTGNNVIQNGSDWFVEAGLGVDTYTLTYDVYDTTIDCGGSNEVELVIHEAPIASFTNPTEPCANSLITFTNTSTGQLDSVFWSITPAGGVSPPTSTEMSPEFTFSVAQDYDITLTVFTFHPDFQDSIICQDEITNTIYISDPPPLAGYVADVYSGCSELEVNFTNQSQGTNLNYYWDFGPSASPPESFMEIPPTIIFAEDTTETTVPVTLEVSNGCGFTSFTDSITISPNPVADFGTDIIPEIYCSGQDICFGNTSYGDPVIFGWYMDNDPNPFSSLQVPDCINFINNSTIPDIHTIMLVVTNNCGMDTLIREITINPTDVNAFISVSEPVVCVGDSITFTSFSTPGADLVWDFGDTPPGTSTENPVTYSYDTAGTYEVVLKVMGCGFDTDIVVIQVDSLPNISFVGPPQVCEGAEALFIGNGPGSYFWDFGDNTTSILPSPSHVYDTAATYTISLTSTLNSGCSNTYQDNILVTPNPVANFIMPDEACQGDLVSFTNTSTSSASINECVWSGGPGPSDCNPEYSFSNFGTFEILLEVEDNNGCIDDTSQWISINPSPTADFEVVLDQSCPPLTGSFIDLSTGATGYSWLVDGVPYPYNGSNPYLFDQGGIYTIELIVDNNGVCIDSHEVVIEINETPSAAFDINSPTGSPDGCAPFAISFENNSIGTNLSYQWYFDYPNLLPFSSDSDPGFSYVDAGNYTVQLIASTPEDCHDTAYIEFEVFEPVEVSHSQNSILCYGDATGFIDLTVDNGTFPFSYDWSNDEMTEDISNITAGSYSITITDANGCIFANTYEMIQPTAPLAHAIVEQMKVTCFGDDDGLVEISGIGGTPSYQYEWENGAMDPLLQGLSAGNYAFTITDSNGCSHTASVTIDENFPVQSIENIQHIDCFNADNGVIDIDTIIGGVPPYFPILTGNNSTYMGNRFGELPPGYYSLNIQDSEGCSLTKEFEILEPDSIFVDILINDTIIQLGEFIELLTNYNALNPQFEWEGDSLDCWDCDVPIARPTESGHFIVNMIDAYGCEVTDSVYVRVEKNRIVAIPNAFTPDGDGYNDIFMVRSGNPAVDQIKTFRIYSRWGELVFEANDIQPNQQEHGWDGNFKGNPLQQGLYVYQVDILYLDGSIENLKGSVLLIR